MKTGIIGYWYATNYGSACTYYALYKTLEKMGHQPIVIDMPEKEKEPFWDSSFARKFIEERCNVSESVKWTETERINDYCDEHRLSRTCKLVFDYLYRNYFTFINLSSSYLLF